MEIAGHTCRRLKLPLIKSSIGSGLAIGFRMRVWSMGCLATPLSVVPCPMLGYRSQKLTVGSP